jgi:hypothetical protein
MWTVSCDCSTVVLAYLAREGADHHDRGRCALAPIDGRTPLFIDQRPTPRAAALTKSAWDETSARAPPGA